MLDTKALTGRYINGKTGHKPAGVNYFILVHKATLTYLPTL